MNINEPDTGRKIPVKADYTIVSKTDLKGLSTYTNSSVSGDIATGNTNRSRRTEHHASSLVEIVSSTKQLTCTVRYTTEYMQQAIELAGETAQAVTMIEKAGEMDQQRLRYFLDDKSDLYENDVATHHDCKLGKWMYGYAMNEFGNMREV